MESFCPGVHLERASGHVNKTTLPRDSFYSVHDNHHVFTPPPYISVMYVAVYIHTYVYAVPYTYVYPMHTFVRGSYYTRAQAIYCWIASI
jgi:hypothetical protein